MRRSTTTGPRRPNWPIIGAVAAILVFVVALLYIMFSTAFSGSLGAQTQNIRVPSVTGQLFSEAQANTELLNGFTLVQGETVESDQPAERFSSRARTPTTSSAETT